MQKIFSKYKVLLSITGIVILVGVIVLFIVAGRYGNKIKAEIPKRFAVATDSLYHISVKKVNVNILTRSVTLKKVDISVDSAKLAQQLTDSNAQKHYYNINIPKLKVSGIMWDKLVGGSGLSFTELRIVDPKIKISKTDTALCKYTLQKTRQRKRDITIGLVKVVNADIIYAMTKGSFAFSHVDIDLNDWENSDDTTRFLMSDKGVIHAADFKYLSPTADYIFDVKNIAFSSTAQKLTASDVTLKLKGSERDFYKKYRTQKEIYDLYFPTLEVTRINWLKLFNNQEFSASSVYLNNFKVNVLFSRLPPENKESKLGKFPNQLLQKLKIPCYLKEVKLNNGSVTYTEESDVTKQKASIYVKELEGNITNITNKNNLTSVNNECHALLSAKLNDYSNIEAKLTFALDKPDGSFDLNLNIGDLKASQITDQTTALTMIAVRSLSMKSLSMRLSGNERVASSDFTMQYSNLGIKILKKADDKKKEKRKKGFITFIANNLILFSANPMPGKEVRHVKTYIKRDENKSFFNLIWRNIHAGVQETTVRDKKVIDWMRREDAKNKARKARKRKEEKR